MRRAKKSKPKKAPVLKVKARVDKCRAYTTLACERLAQILPFVGIALGDAARMRVGSGTAEQAAQTLSVENHDVDVFALASLVFLMVSVYISSEWYGFVSSFCNKSGSKDKVRCTQCCCRRPPVGPAGQGPGCHRDCLHHNCRHAAVVDGPHAGCRLRTWTSCATSSGKACWISASLPTSRPSLIG